MRTRKLTALLLAPLLAVFLVAAAKLVDPAPLIVPTGLSAAAIDKAVRVGVAKRGWIISKQEPGYVEAVLNVRVHMAKIAVKYDSQQVQIHYLDSQNLDYETKSDGPRIHGNYLKWVSNVEHDINVQLQEAALAGSGSG